MLAVYHTVSHCVTGSVSQLVVCVTVAERAQAVCHTVVGTVLHCVTGSVSQLAVCVTVAERAQAVCLTVVGSVSHCVTVDQPECHSW